MARQGEAFATERGDSPDRLLKRLAPEMFPLTAQLRLLAFQALEPVYWRCPVPSAVLQVRQEGRDSWRQTDRRRALKFDSST